MLAHKSALAKSQEKQNYKTPLTSSSETVQTIESARQFTELWK